MENTLIDSLLAQQDLTLVELNALTPDELTYSIAFMQPSGGITASTDGIRNDLQQDAISKHRNFLELVFSENVDLAITPEYSCPWPVMESVLEKGPLPEPGGLWVLGCEAISPEDLTAIAGRQSRAVWLIGNYEARRGHTFLDPLCYIFWTITGKKELQPVVAVQFKGQPMSEHVYNLERDRMIRGNEQFIFRNDEDSVHLTSLICSDALGFNEKDLPRHQHIPYLILHPQLNYKPRYNAFRAYRQDAFLRSDKPEFICVNWAHGFHVGNIEPSTFGGSAYYMKSNSLPPPDFRINEDHRRGMYYTIAPDTQSHIFFFNYSERVFYFRTTKVSQAAASYRVLQNRTGPEMLNNYMWDPTLVRWRAASSIEDGFQGLCEEIGTDLAPLLDKRLGIVDTERLLALSTGAFKESLLTKFLKPSELNSFQVGDNEVVERLTFVQDPDRDAYENRHRLLSLFSHLRNTILRDKSLFPKSIQDFAGNCEIRYPINGSYILNLSKSDLSEYATVVFLGDCSKKKLQHAFSALFNILDDKDESKRDSQRRRLVVWYEKNGQVLSKWDERSLINADLSQSPVSIAKEY